MPIARRVASLLAAALLPTGHAALTTAAAQAQSAPTAPVAMPDSRAGRLVKAWVDAMNSGDSAKVWTFASTYTPLNPPQAALQLARNIGSIDVVKILVDQPLHLEFLVKVRGAGDYARGVVDVSDTDPLVARSFGVRGIPPGAPPEGCKTYTAPATTTTPGEAAAKDVASQDAIIAALYESISGTACQYRDWERFKSLFAPGARLIPTGFNRDRKAVARVETPDEYAAQAKNSLEENGFFEHETARTGETFGAITHAFSTYESRRQANDEKPFARGINSIQLLNDGTRWWVVTVYWQAERPDSPIPPQFLPKKLPSND
jgi:hypothetical protein